MNSVLEIPHRDAGTLYDLVDGKRRYAGVRDGEVIDQGYFDTKPTKQAVAGDTWLPIEHFDSAPVDSAKHWRLKPVVTVEQNRAVVTFPVCDKGWEHA